MQLSREIYREIGRWLRQTRHSRKMSLAGVCKEIGASPATLSRIERGNPCDIDNIKRVAKFIGRPVSAFFGPDTVSVDGDALTAIRRTIFADVSIADPDALYAYFEQSYHLFVGLQEARADEMSRTDIPRAH